MYYDTPYQDVKRLAEDFKSGKLDCDMLMIDMREPDDIKRAVEDFDAKTILVRNPNNNNEYSNHADSGVENYTDYDYIIVNDAGLYELDKCAKSFVEYVEKCSSPVIMCGSDYLTECKYGIDPCRDFFKEWGDRIGHNCEVLLKYLKEIEASLKAFNRTEGDE